MKKKDENSEAMYNRLRSTGAQPARMYGFARVHKQGTRLLPVISLPGSSYDNLNETLAKYFDEIEGANIETNFQMARKILEKTELDSEESIISLDVKILYTNVPLKEAVEIVLRRLYEQVNPLELSRKTMKKLLNLAVSKVHFKCNGLWYVQKDGLAMGASLAVFLANLWLKEYEPALKKEVPKFTVLSEGNKEVCPRFQKKVTYRTKGVECKACLNWYHLGCGNISESEYADIAEKVWYCVTCKKQQEADRTVNGVKVFLRYMEELVRTVKGDPGVVLEVASELAFTVEELDSNCNLAFLDLNVNVDSAKKVTCGWYQKPTAIGTILNFRAAHLCNTKETLMKRRFMGFSEVLQHGNILTRHWKKIGSNGLKFNIQKICLTGQCLKLLTRSLREEKFRGEGIRTEK